MIRKVSSSLTTFKEVDLTANFNIILADRTKDSTKKDTRNGLGKSTFIDVIHFCLGGKVTSASSRLWHPMLSQYEFSLEFELNGKIFSVTRRLDNPTFVTLAGDVSDLPLPEDRGKKSARLSVSDWTRFLGQYWLGVPVDTDRKYAPSFRSVISYFIRSDKDAFNDPFRHFRVQPSWDIQINNAFLLGMDWEDASDWQVLKDRKKSISALQEVIKGGVLGSVLGSRGQLEAERIRLVDLVHRTKEDLSKFRVLSQYRELEREADELSKQIKSLSDDNTVDSQALNMYKNSVREVVESSASRVQELYEQAKVAFPAAVKRELDEVEAFHTKVVENRKQFLLSETDRLSAEIARRKSELERKHDRQAEILALLNTHGALDQYSNLQQAHSEQVSRLRTIEAKLAAVKELEQEKAALKIGIATLEQRARANYETRLPERTKAVELFDANSQALYKAPGRLLIDIGDFGFSFGSEIDRKGSTGISNMEIFCYDLMLAERWAAKRPGSITLIHDSNLFADVDDRQVAAALELAAEKAAQMNFQYICTFNSDKLPQSEFSKGFDIADFTRMRLTDETDEGGLLGMRLPSAATRAPKSSSKKLVERKPLTSATAAVPRINDEDVEEQVEDDEPNLFNQANFDRLKNQNRS
ncbi:MAG: hypothetical protein BGO25_00900 [Acidobacteriales bacterium 59-55]|nr:MAG: hypothetical protein BGO25_00900 [Acidobacteriales bacterium 59-55]